MPYDYLNAIATLPGDAQDEFMGLADYVKLPRQMPEIKQEEVEPVVYAHTDMGNAERFVNQHKQNIRYCPVTRAWYIWDGARWEEDRKNIVYHLARLTVRSIPKEADNYPDDDARRQEVLKWAYKSESKERVRAIVELAKSDQSIVVKPDDFDKNHWLFNVSNGTLNLLTGQLQPHNREDLISKISMVEYDPLAECPLWLQFMDDIFRGNPYLIGYIQKIFGYCLTGSTKEQDFFILYGNGANGKSTLIKIMMALLGSDYAKQTAANAFLVKQNETAGEEIAVLMGARMVVTSEVEDGKKLAEALIKQLTGDTTIRARRLYQDSVEFWITFKILMVVNNKPRISGTDYGMWRRSKLIPFTVTIPEEKQDLDLGDKLIKELPGILNWVLQGCLEWQKKGLKPPEEVDAATLGYRIESDAIGTFLDECVITDDPDAKIQAKTLYDAYKDWCSTAGERSFSMRRFNDRLKERGFHITAGAHNLKFWHGVQVASIDLWNDISREVY